MHFDVKKAFDCVQLEILFVDYKMISISIFILKKGGNLNQTFQ